jgi:hypothetical protein
MLDAEEWNNEKIECQQAEAITGIKVMLGEEGSEDAGNVRREKVQIEEIKKILSQMQEAG